jgi:hypothetical protein
VGHIEPSDEREGLTISAISGSFVRRWRENGESVYADCGNDARNASGATPGSSLKRRLN